MANKELADKIGDSTGDSIYSNLLFHASALKQAAQKKLHLLQSCGTSDVWTWR